MPLGQCISAGLTQPHPNSACLLVGPDGRRLASAYQRAAVCDCPASSPSWPAFPALTDASARPSPFLILCANSARACTHTHTHTHTHTRAHTYTHKHTRVHTHIQTHARVHAHKDTSRRMCMCACTYTLGSTYGAVCGNSMAQFSAIQQYSPKFCYISAAVSARTPSCTLNFGIKIRREVQHLVQSPHTKS